MTKLNVKLLNETDCVQHYPTSTVTDLLMNWESSGNRETEASVPQYPKDSTGDFVDPKSLYYGAIYEVEVWLKYNGPKGTVRRKLDLVAKCHPRKELDEFRNAATANFDIESDDTPAAAAAEYNADQLTASSERLLEADRDYVAHETIVQDMCSYLRNKGIHSPEELLSLPVR